MYNLIYITTKDIAEARKIANYLVRQRLVACCNIIPKIESIYHWKNKTEKASESAMFCKTKKSLVFKVIKEIKKMHSYDVPCVVSLEIKEGDKDFLNWILKETK